MASVAMVRAISRNARSGGLHGLCRVPQHLRRRRRAAGPTRPAPTSRPSASSDVTAARGSAAIPRPAPTHCLIASTLPKSRRAGRLDAARRERAREQRPVAAARAASAAASRRWNGRRSTRRRRPAGVRAARRPPAARCGASPLPGRAPASARRAQTPRPACRRRWRAAARRSGSGGTQPHPGKPRPKPLEHARQAVGHDRLGRPDGQGTGRLAAVRERRPRLLGQAEQALGVLQQSGAGVGEGDPPPQAIEQPDAKLRLRAPGSGP